MSGLRRSPESLRKLAKSLQKLPVVAAQKVAAAVAPDITGLAQSAYSGGRTVYDEPRPVGVAGAPLSLIASGATRAALRFVSIGRIVRCVLGPPYARYLVGKYRILPNGPLPVAWRKAIAAQSKSVIAKELNG